MRGTVRKRGKNWQALVTVKDTQTGKNKQLSSTHPSKADAERWLTLSLARSGSRGGAAHSMTVGELLDHYFEHKAEDWSPSNTRFVRWAIDKVLKPRFGDTPIMKLHPADIDAWYQSLRRRLSANSIRRYHNILSASFRMAVRYDWLPVSPVSKTSPPKATQTPITVPEVEELLLLTAACDEFDSRLGFAVHVAAVTGARRGEIVALRWSDFEQDRRLVHFWNAVIMGEGDKPVLKYGTKTGRKRTVSLDEWTFERLAAHRRWCEEQAALAGARLGSDGYIFSRDFGETPMSPNLLSSMYERARAKVGLKSIRFHDLRHYHATALLTSGVDVATVAGRLGHAGGGRMTLAVYAHFIEPADRRAAEIAVRQLREVS